MYRRTLKSRLILFVSFCVTVFALYAVPLSKQLRQSLHAGYSSHIVLVPLITTYLIWTKRNFIFSSVSSASTRAGQISAVALLLTLIALLSRGRPWMGSTFADFLIVLSPLLLVVAGFIAVFGTAAFKKAVFPFGMFVFMLPVPSTLLERIVYFLQAESANLSAWMFSVLGVPVVRDGFLLALPGVTIEVGKECSGINSSVALLILMIIFAHETLRSNWRRVILVLLTMPLAISKNAIRIVTLTLLAMRIDPGFLTGRLHHEGGFVFFLITLVLVFPIWNLLRKTETTHEIPGIKSHVDPSYANRASK